VNVGSRFNRAGFTGTRGVLVSAVPSAGVGGPAPLLGGPGIEGWIVVFWPQRARFAAALVSRSAEYPQPQVNTRSASVRVVLTAPQAGHSLLDGYQRSATRSARCRAG